MKTRMTLLIGFGAGYVLGTRAGRERYEQLKRWWHSVTASPQVQGLTGRGKEMAEEAGRKGIGAVQSGVSKIGSNVKNRLGNGDGQTVDIATQGIGI
ncbi:MAG: hypothetical protein ABR600_00720 [Actinomycetota bacterium]